MAVLYYTPADAIASFDLKSFGFVLRSDDDCCQSLWPQADRLLYTSHNVSHVLDLYIILYYICYIPYYYYYNMCRMWLHRVYMCASFINRRDFLTIPLLLILNSSVDHLYKFRTRRAVARIIIYYILVAIFTMWNLHSSEHMCKAQSHRVPPPTEIIIIYNHYNHVFYGMGDTQYIIYIWYCSAACAGGACGVISMSSKKNKINHDIRRSRAACRSIMRSHCFVCAYIMHILTL